MASKELADLLGAGDLRRVNGEFIDLSGMGLHWRGPRRRNRGPAFRMAVAQCCPDGRDYIGLIADTTGRTRIEVRDMLRSANPRLSTILSVALAVGVEGWELVEALQDQARAGDRVAGIKMPELW